MKLPFDGRFPVSALFIPDVENLVTDLLPYSFLIILQSQPSKGCLSLSE